MLTIIDSSDEEDSKPATPKKPKPSTSSAKGKGKRPAPSTDTESAVDVDEDGYEAPPSVRKSSQYDATSDDVGGDLDSTDEEDAAKEREGKAKEGGKDGSGGKGAMLLQKDFKSSTKLDALVESLSKAREGDPALKAVVFSQVSAECSRCALTN